MEWIAITLLALVLVVGALVFLAFTQFREAIRQTAQQQQQIKSQIDDLARKLDRLAPKPSPEN
jgi:type II secretory pathway component PulJ